MENTKQSSLIKSLKIGIANKDQILTWSYGEIVSPETINYKTGKPVWFSTSNNRKPGLFDESVFGPIKDYTCACGRYNKAKFKNKKCETCGVDIVEAIVRRERMGHIQLNYPVAHIWMSKESPSPSKISLLLDITNKELDSVLYFVDSIVLDDAKFKLDEADKTTLFKTKEILDFSSATTRIEHRAKIIHILKYITKMPNIDEITVRRCEDYISFLKEDEIPFSIPSVFKLITKFTGVKFGFGAEAIKELLANINLQAERANIDKQLKKLAFGSPRYKKQLKRKELIQWFINSGQKPDSMILNYIPVLPPDTRPMIQLENGLHTSVDVNELYRRIIIRNNRIKEHIEKKSPDIIINNERRMLQEAVDALFDNASLAKPILSKDKRPLASITDKLKGKQGLFRQNMLGKRVDFSGRTVIVVGPELKMYEAGVPTEIILKLFRPFIIRELIKKTDEYGNEITPIALTINAADKMIINQETVIWDIVQRVIKERPILLNRAPTLHRLGIQAFEVKMIDGKAIRLHPLVCAAFNADFDGDQMAIHLPISPEAVAEARSILLASWHILGPKDGKPVVTPTQDMILGIYYLSTEQHDQIGEGMILSSVDEVKKLLASGVVHPHTIIGIPANAFAQKRFETNGILITTVGKVIINSILPPDMPYIYSSKGIVPISKDIIAPKGSNVRDSIAKHKIFEPFVKKTLQEIVLYINNHYPVEVVASTMDELKKLGFRYSTRSATTISVYDVPHYNKKDSYLKLGDEKVQELENYYRQGLLTDDERYLRVIKLWTEQKDKVSTDVEKIINDPENKNNSIIVMAKSGARGNINQFTQLIGMRGLMSRPWNYEQVAKNKGVPRDTIEIPIKHSFIEGLNALEYFNSSYGARKGMADTATKTSKAGYMTRKLVDAAQEVTIVEEDCGTTKGLVVSAILDEKENRVIETLSERIANRFANENIKHPKTNEIIVASGDIITTEKATLIEKIGIKSVEVRSVLHCKSKYGVCTRCFGNDLTTNRPIELHTAIGVIAAQSIGEPGTQLNMRTFHTGGAASAEGNLAQGFQRLSELFGVVPPKWNKAAISEFAGVVKSITQTFDKNHENDPYHSVVVQNRILKQEYKIPLELKLLVKAGQRVDVGQQLSNGTVDLKEYLRVVGLEQLQNYFIKEVQKVYRIQGIEIADKYIEIILKQMTNKWEVANPGDSEFSTGDIVNVNILTDVNNTLLLEGKSPILAENKIFGLEDVPAKSDSFLAAASFQDTKIVLTNAAAKSQTDALRGLKENVMLGRLIPVGTGKQDQLTILENGRKMYKKEY